MFFGTWKHGTVLVVMQAVRAPDPSYRILRNLAGKVYTCTSMPDAWCSAECFRFVIRNLKNPQTALWVRWIQQNELQLLAVPVREFLTVSIMRTIDTLLQTVHVPVLPTGSGKVLLLAVRIVFLDRVQNLQIHVMRANQYICIFILNRQSNSF